MPNRSAIATLSELLEESHAKPKMRIERLAPSAIYDLDYRVFVVAAAFERTRKLLHQLGGASTRHDSSSCNSSPSAPDSCRS